VHLLLLGMSKIIVNLLGLELSTTLQLGIQIEIALQILPAPPSSVSAPGGRNLKMLHNQISKLARRGKYQKTIRTQ
jgi:hypothetical protein